MKAGYPFLIASLALIVTSLACEGLNRGVSLSNLRMAFDQDGAESTTVFAPSDELFAVADLANAPVGTVVVARWIAVNVQDIESNFLFQEQTLTITEESPPGLIYFQLTNAGGWLPGEYKVELYLNGTLSQSAVFRIEQ